VQYGGGGELQADEVLPVAVLEAGPARELVALAQGHQGGGSGLMQRPGKVAQAQGGTSAVEDGHQPLRRGRVRVTALCRTSTSGCHCMWRMGIDSWGDGGSGPPAGRTVRALAVRWSEMARRHSWVEVRWHAQGMAGWHAERAAARGEGQGIDLAGAEEDRGRRVSASGVRGGIDCVGQWGGGTTLIDLGAGEGREVGPDTHAQWSVGERGGAGRTFAFFLSLVTSVRGC
jgi:hypothetical protein